MMTYLRNVWLWLHGLVHLEQLTYKPGWNAAKFFPLYVLDYGLLNTVFLAGPVVSISRYAYMRRASRPWSWLCSLLDHIQPMHVESAGPVLWGSTECPPWLRIAIPLLWIGLFVGLRYGKWS
jgi:hypothetical protein